MKSIYSIILCLTLTIDAFAANLTATPTPASFGKKDGKITLLIVGGFAPYTILWSGPGGYSSSKMNPDSLAAGTYCVSVTDQYCGTATLCIAVSEKTNSIQEIEATKMTVYPNPFTIKLFIEIPNVPLGKATLMLYDQLGKEVATAQTEAKQTIQWNLKNALPAGIYTLNVTLEDGTQMRRQIISLVK